MSTELRRPAWLPSHIPELDGLRGIAILAVVTYHCADKFQWLPILRRVIHEGWAGVDLFFVLSGFLITGILVDGRARDPWLKNFYVRRILRIWPLYFFLVTLFAILAWSGFDSFARGFRGTPWWMYVIFVQNLFHAYVPGALGPTWSLAIEEQFYFLWAPTVRLARTSWLKWLLFVVLVVSPILRIVLWNRVTETNTLLHLDGLALGSLLALLTRSGWQRRTWKLIGTACLLVGGGFTIWLVPIGTGFLSSAVALTCFGAVALGLASNGERSLYAGALRMRWLRFLGTISYGFYLVHLTVYAYAGNLDPHVRSWGWVGDMVSGLARVLLSIGVAAALWYGLESPVLSLKSRFAGDAPARPKVAAEPVPEPALVGD